MIDYLLPFPSAKQVEEEDCGECQGEYWHEEFAMRLAQILIQEMRDQLVPTKDWYSTDELARAVGRSPITIRQKWCRDGRVEAVKEGGKWRIPSHEYHRLARGGGLRPPARNSERYCQC